MSGRQKKAKPAAAATTKNASKLMRAMGSTTGAFDPEPPDQWKYDLLYGAPDDRYVACVKSHTVAVGHMTPYATGERGPGGQEGPILTLKEIRHELSWERKYAEKVARECDRQGRTDRDPRLNADGTENHRRRIWLRAEVREVSKVEESETYGKDGTLYSSRDSLNIRLLPTYVADQIKSLDAEKQSITKRFFELYEPWYNRSMAESAQATRAMTDRVLHAVLEAVGVEFRPAPVKKKGKPDSGRAAQGDLFEWHHAQTSNMDIRITKIPEALEALLPESLRAPVQAPQEPAQTPPPTSEPHEGTGFLYTTVYTEKIEPATLLCSDPDQIVEVSKLGTPVADRATDLPAQPPKPSMKPAPRARGRKTIPMSGATRAEPPRRTAAASEARARGEQTGLAGTPSIENRRRETEIINVIPDMLARQCKGSKYAISLIRQINEALQGAPAAELGSTIAEEWGTVVQTADGEALKPGRRPAYFTRLGLLINLAQDLGNAWAAGAADRASAEAGRIRREQASRAEVAKLVLLAEYGDWCRGEAENLYKATSAVKLGMWEIEKRTILKSRKLGKGKESQWDRLDQRQRAVEIKQLILLDLARNLPTFDEWLKGRGEMGAAAGELSEDSGPLAAAPKPPRAAPTPEPADPDGKAFSAGLIDKLKRSKP